MKILIANLGNRNIKYIGQGYDKDFIPNSSFLNETKRIWENFDVERKNLKPCVLPEFLDRHSDADRLILFTTYQKSEKSEGHPADTYYEGRILRELFHEKYPNITVDLIDMIDGKSKNGIDPTQENQLIPFFTLHIHSLIFQNPKAKFVYYETGGTSQLKNSLRSVFEYYISLSQRESFEGAYLIQEDKTLIRKKERDESEKLFLKRQIKTLIDNFNYAAANLLAAADGGKEIGIILKYLNLRWNGMWHEVNTHCKPESFSKRIKRSEEFQYITFDEFVSNDFKNSTNYFRCITLIDKAEALIGIGEYSGGMLALHQFIENFVRHLIIYNERLDVSDRKNVMKILQHLKENYADEIREIFDLNAGVFPEYLSLPLLIFWAEKITQGNEGSTKIIYKIKSLNSKFGGTSIPKEKKLDVLRNSIAHDGKGVAKSDYDKYYKHIVAELKTLLSHERNHFKELNKLALLLV